MADAGTDNFDREFALSLVSSEQDGLYEVEAALKRLEAGSFGLCDMCEKPIARPRLEAVPPYTPAPAANGVARHEPPRRTWLPSDAR